LFSDLCPLLKPVITIRKDHKGHRYKKSYAKTRPATLRVAMRAWRKDAKAKITTVDEPAYLGFVFCAFCAFLDGHSPAVAMRLPDDVCSRLFPLRLPFAALRCFS
jgi:hypothetical protein